MTFKIIQITKINTHDFKFLDTANLTSPIPPLASAKLFMNDGVQTLKICATLYINSRDSQNPFIGTITENDSNFEIYFDYDWDDKSPDTYDVWYVETDYVSETVGNITEVISYLKNLNSRQDVELGNDPTTSRGTKTSSGD